MTKLHVQQARDVFLGDVVRKELLKGMEEQKLNSIDDLWLYIDQVISSHPGLAGRVLTGIARVIQLEREIDSGMVGSPE